MLRSFDYAAFNVLHLNESVVRPENRHELQPWADRWSNAVGQHFLDTYFEKTAGSDIVPQKPAQREHLMNAYLMNKAVYGTQLRAQQPAAVGGYSHTGHSEDARYLKPFKGAAAASGPFVFLPVQWRTNTFLLCP